ncbi:unnamed protein product [Protopolystoma xenopodis]|uniref:RING-type domain-containing protein n=1 Tax=Protopolystoma xenopodis TaxID=117903 RepID=A0A3S5CHU5_9PLAT|nr:unnamed protein product [Protopolystoma xenopodis]
MQEVQELVQERLREVTTCRVCMDQPISRVFFPCGHTICCSACSERIDQCPVCRKAIDLRHPCFLPWAISAGTNRFPDKQDIRPSLDYDAGQVGHLCLNIGPGSRRRHSTKSASGGRRSEIESPIETSSYQGLDQVVPVESSPVTMPLDCNTGSLSDRQAPVDAATETLWEEEEDEYSDFKGMDNKGLTEEVASAYRAKGRSMPLRISGLHRRSLKEQSQMNTRHSPAESRLTVLPETCPYTSDSDTLEPTPIAAANAKIEAPTKSALSSAIAVFNSALTVTPATSATGVITTSFASTSAATTVISAFSDSITSTSPTIESLTAWSQFPDSTLRRNNSSSEAVLCYSMTDCSEVSASLSSESLDKSSLLIQASSLTSYEVGSSGVSEVSSAGNGSFGRTLSISKLGYSYTDSSNLGSGPLLDKKMAFCTPPISIHDRQTETFRPTLLLKSGLKERRDSKGDERVERERISEAQEKKEREAASEGAASSRVLMAMDVDKNKSFTRKTKCALGEDTSMPIQQVRIKPVVSFTLHLDDD